MKFKIKIIAIIALTALLLTCITTHKVDYSALGNPADKVPLNSKTLAGSLSNGLRYYILENSLPEDRAYAALVVNAGSALERDDQRGFAHFIEHLAFLDTARFPDNEITEYLRSLGSRFGANVNAYTSYNETVYHFDLPTETIDGVKRIPERALAILDDWTYAVTFNPEFVESERRVVLEEIRTRAGAMDRVRRITLPVLFKDSAFEDRHVIGLAEVIENAATDQLKEFYNRWYTSDNMALVFVGDFDGKALEAELEKQFNMPSAAQSVNRPRYELPPPKNGNFHVQIVTDPELTDTSFNIYYKQKRSAQRGTIEYYRETILDYLISSMLSLRFQEMEADPQSAAAESWGGIWRWSQNSSFYSLGNQPKTGNAEEALKELLLEKESIRRYGFTQSELERAKLNLVSYMEKQLSEKDRTQSRSFIRGFTNHFLYNEDMADIEWEMDAVNFLLPGIGIKEISQTVKGYFSANDVIVFLIAPQNEEETLPSEERIRAIFRETQNARINPRKDVSLSGELLPSLPFPGTISKEEIDKETGAHIITLSNGATIILKETANRNNEITMYAAANGGMANAKAEEIVSVNLLSEMINVSGLGPYSRTELINKLAGKQVSISFWMSNYSRGFQGSSTTQDINTFFELIYLFFNYPRLEGRAIDAMIDQYRTNLANLDDDPQKVFSRELNKILTGNHPLFLPLELNDMEKVSMHEAMDFLYQCINPADYTFIFTGNINLEVMRELSAVYIASIPKNASMNNWSDPEIQRPSAGRRTIYKGVDQRSIVYLGWFSQGSPVFDEKRNQVSAVLSEYLDIILTDEIREKMGGVYSISAGASVATIPRGENRINVYFVCNPQRADELISAVENSINEILVNPINISTFNKAKEALLMEHQRAIQRNLHIAQSYANSSVIYNTPLNRINRRPDAIRAVTPEDMRKLCAEMVISKPVEVVLFPEGWE